MPAEQESFSNEYQALGDDDEACTGSDASLALHLLCFRWREGSLTRTPVLL